MKLLPLRVPDLYQSAVPTIQPKRLLGKFRISKREKRLGTDFMTHFSALQDFLRDEGSEMDLDTVERWGKFNILASGKSKLSSRLSELRGDLHPRSSRYFEVSQFF